MMEGKKGMSKRVKWLRITRQVALMVFFCVLLCLVPLLLKDSIMDAFLSVGANASITAEGAGGTFFQLAYLLFAGLLGGMLIMNLVFFSIDESLNDTVRPRRVIQIILNCVFILCGTGVFLYLVRVYFPAQYWWESILFSRIAARRLTWLPALVFAGCSTLQMFWDVWWFGALNRTQRCRRDPLK